MIATIDRDALPGFERRLLEALMAEARAAAAAGAPALPRRPRARLAVAAGAVATAAVLAATVLPAGDDGRVGGPLPVLGPQAASAAEVTAQAVAALEAARDVVLHAVQITSTPEGEYRAEMWFDEREAGNFRSLTFDDAGRPAYDAASRVEADGTVVHRSIDLVAGTWYESVGTETGPGGAITEGERIRRQLEEGHLTQLRRAELDGRLALVLADDEPGMNREVWVDPETHLPLRMTANWAPGESYRMDYTWIAGAEAGEELFRPEPPAGSREVPAPPIPGASGAPDG